MNRRTIIILLLVSGILSALYIAGNVIARTIIEERLTSAIGLKTRIAGFWISPLQRKITIKNFTIANPEGFSDKPLFRLKSCSALVAWSTLTQDIIHVEAIKLRGITINGEHADTRFNLDSLKRGAAPEDRRTGEKAEHNTDKNQAHMRKLFIIDTLQAKDIEVRISSSTLGKNSIHFKLPNVVMDNFADTEETPLTADEIIYKLVYSIIDRLVAQSPENYQKLIRKFLLEQLDSFYKNR
jgi:uncharacterized protein involved in outer membrane biogenesis